MAAAACTEAILLGVDRAQEKPDPFTAWLSRRARWAAIDAGQSHGIHEGAVEPGIAAGNRSPLQLGAHESNGTTDSPGRLSGSCGESQAGRRTGGQAEPDVSTRLPGCPPAVFSAAESD